MRKLIGVLLLVSVSVAGPAMAQQVGLKDLQGATISGAINFVGRARVLKNNMEQSGEFDWRFTIAIGPGQAIKGTIATEARTGGKSANRTRTFSGTMGQPSLGEEGGPKAVLWTLQAGTLTSLRVLGVGAGVVKISLTRSASGLKCVARGSHAREIGAGDTKAISPFGDRVEVLHIRQASSSCHVTKQN